MHIFQQIMYAFYAGLTLVAIGIAAWFYKKKKESDR
jgi:LPXTG-motif cell wall-anchored protein